MTRKAAKGRLAETTSEMAPPSPKGSREMVVDGSNALYGGGADATPKVKNLELVIKELKNAGWKPVVYVDASRKHDVDDRAKLRTMIAAGVVRDIPAGTPADYWILQYATKHGCKVLSNDLFADWAEKFPIVGEPDRFVRFMVNGGEAYLEEVGGASFPKSRTRTGKRPLKAHVRPLADVKKPIPIKPRSAAEIQKKAEFARRPERREKKTWGRVPSPAPKAERPKELPGAGRGPAVHRTGLRTAWEGVLVGTGLALLISSFIVSYGLIGRAPEPSNVAGVAILIAIGAIPTLFCRRGCSEVVRKGGGSAFAAAGLGLLLFSFLATRGLMWETLQLSNVVWLGVMIAVGALLAAAGIQMIRELGDGARKAWGSAFAAAGLGALVICVIVAYDLMGRVLQWANLVWLGIMMAVGAFAAWEGFPLVLEPKDRIRLAWEGAFMAASIGTLISCVVPVRGLLDKTLETANAVAWLSILVVIGTFLLASGIGRVREGDAGA